MANPFVHVELATSDLGEAKKFYKALFGWKLNDTPMPGGMNYTLIDVGGGVGGGMMAKPMPDVPTAWLAYVLVDDVKKSIATARKNGATIIADYQEVMGMGAFGVFIDPTGAMLGLWQAFSPAPATKPAARKKAVKKAVAKKPAKKPVRKATRKRRR